MRSSMKIGIILAVLLSLAMGVGTVSGHFVEEPCKIIDLDTGLLYGLYPLYGGQYIPAGDVMVWSDTSTLYVKYMTYGGWYLTETHLAIADDVSGIPHNKGGPIPGKFDYSNSNIAQTEWMYSIPQSDLPANDGTLTILAHAVVRNGRIEETAWGKENCTIRLDMGEWKFPGSKWATYFQYTL